MQRLRFKNFFGGKFEDNFKILTTMLKICSLLFVEKMQLSACLLF